MFHFELNELEDFCQDEFENDLYVTCRITIHVLQQNKIEMRKPLNLCYVKATTHQHATEKKGFPHDHYNTRYEIPSIPDSLR